MHATTVRMATLLCQVYSTIKFDLKFDLSVIVFRINIASPVLNSFVLMAQMLSTGLCKNDPFAISGYTPSY